MIWGESKMFKDEIRRICPFIDFFHVYKKMLENIWSQPELFNTFIAPLMHIFYPNSIVKKKPPLKQIELTLTCCRLVYPSIRDSLLYLNDMALDPKIKTHIRNIIFMFEFLLPTVYCLSYIYACYQKKEYILIFTFYLGI